MKLILTYFAVAVLLASYSFESLGGVTWTALQPKRTVKRKTKVWQIQVKSEKGESLIYLIRSVPPQINIFRGNTKYHRPLSLASFGVQKITEVGLAEPLEGMGQVVYLGDQLTQRVFYITLGQSRIREFPLKPGPKAYKEFITRLHPVPEAERHL